MSQPLYAFIIKKYDPNTNKNNVLFTRKFALVNKSDNKLKCQLLQDLDFSYFVEEKDVITVELYQIKKNKDETLNNTWVNFLKNYSKFKLVTKFNLSIKSEKTEYKNSEGGLLRLCFRYRKITQKKRNVVQKL